MRGDGYEVGEKEEGTGEGTEEISMSPGSGDGVQD